MDWGKGKSTPSGNDALQGWYTADLRLKSLRDAIATDNPVLWSDQVTVMATRKARQARQGTLEIGRQHIKLTSPQAEIEMPLWYVLKRDGFPWYEPVNNAAMVFRPNGAASWPQLFVTVPPMITLSHRMAVMCGHNDYGPDAALARVEGKIAAHLRVKPR
jgi:hypothetical protein